MHITFGRCYHCSKEVIYPASKPKKFCSIECYREFESTSKSKRGHMTRVASDKKNGLIRKETWRNVHNM
jgi:hypothetical protein